MSESNDILLDIIMELHKRLIAPSVGFPQWTTSQVREEKKKSTKRWTSSKIYLISLFLQDN